MLTNLSGTGIYWQDTKELTESIRERDQGEGRSGRSWPLSTRQGAAIGDLLSSDNAAARVTIAGHHSLGTATGPHSGLNCPL